MRHRRLAALALAALALGALPATASAQEPVRVNVAWQAAPTSLDDLTVAYQCAAEAPGASWVSVRCGIHRAGGRTVAGPATLHADVETVPNDPFQICWSASALLPGGETTTSGCTAASTALVGWSGS